MRNAHWLDRSLYPFESRYLELDEGHMHYVDEGRGRPLLMVHGTPTWSFLYRDLIKALSSEHRVIAPDHLGFGLSDMPESGAYRPKDHARRLTYLIEKLDLKDLTLVVHDFGGPIGLSYALEHPDNVSKLVLFNSWLWSLEGSAPVERACRLFGSTVGRLLYTRLNFSPKVLMKVAYGDKEKLSPDVHKHYVAPFPTAGDRMAPWVLAKELVGSSKWYGSLWQRRDRIMDTPALILWGMKDPTFGEAYLEQWEQMLSRAEVVRLPEIGHFVPEEAAGAVAPLIQQFLAAEYTFE